MPELDPDVLTYYERGGEMGRLDDASRSGALERERTKELILRSLPEDPSRILDVGGGAGVYAIWLASLGHDVQLIDPVPLHVEQAQAAGVQARVGDARDLDIADTSVDVVLMLGPLYHLIDLGDRLRALEEAARVLRPGGLLYAAAIARGAGLLDLLIRHDRLQEPELLEVVTECLGTGVHRGLPADAFTTAYFHLPSELRREVTTAGFAEVQVLGIEGPGFLVGDQADRLADPERREPLLRAARLTEDQPEMLGALGHLLATARRAA